MNKPSDYKDILINEYLVNNLTTGQIAKKYNLLLISTQKYLSSKVGLKSISDGMNRYGLNKNLLDNIDKEWKAYFLGWLISDGNIYTNSNKYTISLCITESDKYILEYFSNKFYSKNKPLNYRKARLKKGTNYLAKPLYRFQIDNVYLVNKLKEIGIIERKTNNIKIPKIIPNFLIRHFIRGVFEGDGCISNNSITIATASVDFANEISKLLKCQNIENNISISNRKPYKDLYIIQIKRKSNELFRKYIYDNCEMKLVRKFIKFKNDNI